MAKKNVMEQLAGTTFLNELHHLLWTDAFDNNGTWDEGWNCRDHALVAGALLQVREHKVALFYGRARYVEGPNRTRSPF